MMRAENSSLPEEWVLPRSWSKNTPGLRCSCDTMTRSVPLMMKVPLSVMRGSSPKYTSCSRTSLTGFFTPLASLDVEYRFAQAVTHVLESRVTGVAGNGEHAVKRGVQADLIAFGLRG